MFTILHNLLILHLLTNFVYDFSDMSNMKAAKPVAANASPTTKNLPDSSASQRSKPGQAQKKKKRSGKF